MLFCTLMCRGLSRALFVLAFLVSALAAASAPDPAPPSAPVPAGDVALATELVVSGLVQPVGIAHAPGDAARLFIVEQGTGRIRIVENDELLAQPFLDIGAIITPSSEGGLLSLAFHPEYPTNGFFYIYYDDLFGNSVLARFSVDPGDPRAALPGSESILLTIAQPFLQHNGGTLGFGPHDGYLYLATGDGGSGNDPFGNGQNLGTLLGKVLRIDVDGPAPYSIPDTNPFVGMPTFKPEIVAYGLRNPWRGGFDRVTGDLFLGDVGQEAREEVNLLRAGDLSGLNFGWGCLEGELCVASSGCCDLEDHERPLWAYDHNAGCAIIGGSVYRGAAIPRLDGTYFFGDYCTGSVWSFRPGPTVGITELTDRTLELSPPGGTLGFISTFGEDLGGEIYLALRDTGLLYRIVEADRNPDCDGDGTPDAAEIAAGTAFDVNVNGVPDECELLLGVTPLVQGAVSTLTFLGAQPGDNLAVFWTVRGIDSGPCVFMGTLCLDVSEPIALLDLGGQIVFQADAQGVLTLGLPIPVVDSTVSITVSFQLIIVDGLNSKKSNPVQKVFIP